MLHGYWRSSASYRVRLALALKGLAYEQVTHDLRTGAQRDPAFLTLNPQGLVPALAVEGGPVLVQSLAILEWLEERFPERPLLPAGPDDRATVRAMAEVIACDIHPLGNLRVLGAVRSLGADETAVRDWIARWVGEGFAALEAQVARHGRGFCFGNAPTIADCCLVPQLYNAERFGVDLSAYPALVATGAALRALPEAATAHPDRQPDAG